MKKLIVSSVTSNTKSLAVAIMMIVLSIGLLAFGQILIKQIIESQTNIEQINDRSHHQHSLLNTLNTGLNETGIKSAFNVFLEKKGRNEAAHVERLIADIKLSLGHYKALDHINDTEAVALVKLNAIIDKIQNNYLLATNLIDTKNLVKLRDLSALINQEEINHSLTSLHHAYKQNNNLMAQMNEDKINQIISFITFGSGFILIIVAVGIYVLNLFIRHNNELVKLQHNNQQLSSIFQDSPLATMYYDSRGQIQRVNAKAAILFGGASADLESMKITELFSQDDQVAFIEFNQQDFSDQFTQTVTPHKNLNISNLRGVEIPVDISINNISQHQEEFRVITFRNRIDHKRTLKLMNENQLMLNQAQQIANIGSWNWELATDTLIWSDQAYRIYGYQPGEIEINNDTLMSRIPPEERELVGNAINESVIFNKEYHIVHSIIRVDGSTAVVEEHGKVVRDENDKAVRMIGTVHDITQLKQTEQQLGLSANVFEHTTEAIVVTDASNIILKTNAAFERISGFSKKEVCNMELAKVLRANSFDQSFYQGIKGQLETNDSWQGEVWNVRKNGEVYPTWQNISAIKNSEGVVIQYLYLFTDVSQDKLTAKNIREIAKFDQLTLLPNRSVFIERLRHTVDYTQENKVTAVFSISLNSLLAQDNALRVQDQDRLISATADLISHLIRQQDSVMRAGLNEFNVIIRDLTSGEDAYIIAEKIIHELSMPLDLNNNKINPGCSIGIALHPAHTRNYYDLIKYADAAMTSAKNNPGHGTKVFNPHMLLDYTDSDHQGHELRRAIESQELTINFEPQLDLSNNRMTAATAKILWTHPELGSISYHSFKHVAEQAGLNEALFSWLLESACQQASQWSTTTLGDVAIDVEISPILLESPGLSNKVGNILTTYQLKPQRLRLNMAQLPLEKCCDVANSEIEKIQHLGVTVNFIKTDSSELAISDIKRIGFNAMTVTGALTQANLPVDVTEQLKNTTDMISSLTLNETMTNNPLMTALANITDIGTATSSQYYLTGRHLTQDELLELSNAVNAHNVLNKHTASS